MVESGGDRLRLWRHAINDAARHARGIGGEPAVGPVGVELHFRMRRPASAPKRRRTWPVGARSGDVDKLARAALDAVTGVLVIDDAQVVDLRVTKDWADAAGPGVQVALRVFSGGGDLARHPSSD